MSFMLSIFPRGLLGVLKFFLKSFPSDVESTILGRSERQRKENENFLRKKNACHIIWEAFWEESLEMSSIVLFPIELKSLN
jgi:hypothetical protein